MEGMPVAKVEPAGITGVTGDVPASVSNGVNVLGPKKLDPTVKG